MCTSIPSIDPNEIMVLIHDFLFNYVIYFKFMRRTSLSLIFSRHASVWSVTSVLLGNCNFLCAGVYISWTWTVLLQKMSHLKSRHVKACFLCNDNTVLPLVDSFKTSDTFFLPDFFLTFWSVKKEIIIKIYRLRSHETFFTLQFFLRAEVKI